MELTVALRVQHALASSMYFSSRIKTIDIKIEVKLKKHMQHTEWLD
jgi:hypothetical protein